MTVALFRLIRTLHLCAGDDGSAERARKELRKESAKGRERGAYDSNVEFHGGPCSRARVVPCDVFADGYEVKGVEAEN